MEACPRSLHHRHRPVVLPHRGIHAGCNAFRGRVGRTGPGESPSVRALRVSGCDREGARNGQRPHSLASWAKARRPLRSPASRRSSNRSVPAACTSWHWTDAARWSRKTSCPPSAEVSSRTTRSLINRPGAASRRFPTPTTPERNFWSTARKAASRSVKSPAPTKGPSSPGKKPAGR